MDREKQVYDLLKELLVEFSDFPAHKAHGAPNTCVYCSEKGMDGKGNLHAMFRSLGRYVKSLEKR